jgi:cob(I)alamin adenosyltransferase
MGYRLSRITTGTGDAGETGLGDGSRVAKHHARIEAIGDVDELNSHVGMVLCYAVPDEVRRVLEDVQHDLFHLGGELAVPGRRAVRDADVGRLQEALDAFNEALPPLREFILPGGRAPAVACHVARAVCRRAERRVVALAAREEVGAEVLRYLNRLSDLLFVVARVLVREAGAEEVFWDPARNRQEP